MITFTAAQGTNQYILLDLIGAGGMVEVYTCKRIGQRGFEKLIVLKKLKRQVAENSEIATNFIDEARLAAQLAHENIATIYDFGEIDGSYFIAMEYLFGQNLHSVVRRAGEAGKTMDVEMALKVASKICAALEYAHTLKDPQQRPLNIIHRNLTPHNVFITYEGKVKIINFGIVKARLFDNRTQVGMANGKSSYMSPEYLAGGDIDHRSDIFSIAILLYEMLSGQGMYSGDTATLTRKCMEVEYKPLEKVLPGLQPELYSVVHMGLAKDRNLRYQSCREMGEAIDDCLSAVAKRPSSQRLKEYIRGQFKDEFETDKASLFAAASRWGKSSHSMEFDKPGVERLLTSEAAIMDKPFFQERRTAGSSRRWVSGFAGLLLCLLALGIISYIVLYYGNEKEADPSPSSVGQDRQQTEIMDKVQQVVVPKNFGGQKRN